MSCNYNNKTDGMRFLMKLCLNMLDNFRLGGTVALFSTLNLNLFFYWILRVFPVFISHPFNASIFYQHEFIDLSFFTQCPFNTRPLVMIKGSKDTFDKKLFIVVISWLMLLRINIISSMHVPIFNFILVK